MQELRKFEIVIWGTALQCHKWQFEIFLTPFSKWNTLTDWPLLSAPEIYAITEHKSCTYLDSTWVCTWYPWGGFRSWLQHEMLDSFGDCFYTIYTVLMRSSTNPVTSLLRERYDTVGYILQLHPHVIIVLSRSNDFNWLILVWISEWFFHSLITWWFWPNIWFVWLADVKFQSIFIMRRI
jgi:hypothetical protein